MHQLIDLVDALLREIAGRAVARESLEWYLRNNLEDFRRKALGSPAPRALEGAARALSHFCTDSMEWDSELFRACTRITDLAARLAKADPGCEPR
jgi:hypothetical protein